MRNAKKKTPNTAQVRRQTGNTATDTNSDIGALTIAQSLPAAKGDNGAAPARRGAASGPCLALSGRRGRKGCTAHALFMAAYDQQR